MAAALNDDRILLTVFAHANYASLFRAAQVSRRWAARATDVLWHAASARDLLGAVAEHRRPVYAAKMRVLHHFSGARFLPGGLFAELHFPRAEVAVGFNADSVRSLRELAARCPLLRRVGCYSSLHPYLSIAGDDMYDVDVDAGEALFAPSHFDGDDDEDDDDDDEDELSGDESYDMVLYADVYSREIGHRCDERSISSNCSYYSVIEKVESSISSQPAGHRLAYESRPFVANLAAAAQRLQLHEQRPSAVLPFGSLRELSVQMLSKAVPALLATLNAAEVALTHLSLRVLVGELPDNGAVRCSSAPKTQHAAADAILPAVAKLTQLRALAVRFATSQTKRTGPWSTSVYERVASADVVVLPSKHIVGLSRLTLLRSLTLRGCTTDGGIYTSCPSVLVAAPDFDRAAMHALLEPLGTLEHLVLELTACPLPYNRSVVAGGLCCALRDFEVRRVLTDAAELAAITHKLPFTYLARGIVASVRVGLVTGYRMGPDFW